MKQKRIFARGLKTFTAHCSFFQKVVNLAGVKSLMRQLVLHPEGNWGGFSQRKCMKREKKKEKKTAPFLWQLDGMTEGWMKRDLGDYVFIFINELLKSTEEVFIYFFVLNFCSCCSDSHIS